MSQFELTKRKAEDPEEVPKKAKKVEEVVPEEVEDSSLVDYLAQVIYVCKKLSYHFLLHFPIGMSPYDHHAKYQGVFP